jgi:hypothetical protein
MCACDVRAARCACAALCVCACVRGAVGLCRCAAGREESEGEGMFAVSVLLFAPANRVHQFSLRCSTVSTWRQPRCPAPPPRRCAACVQTRNTSAPPQTLAGWPAQSMTINCVRTSRTRRLAKEVRASGSARPWSEGKSYPRRGMAGMVGSGCGVNAEGVSPTGHGVGSGCGVNAEGVSPTGHGVGSGCGGVNAAPAVLCRPR